jgi:hypothetical protein
VGSSDVSAGMNGDATLAVIAGLTSGGVGYDLFLFERATPDEPFGTPRPLVEVNSASDDYDPCLSPNGLALVFHSNRQGTYDIFLARRASTDVEFEAPVSLAVNSPDFAEEAPHISLDPGLMMYSSDRGGSLDIYEAALFP